MRIKLSLSLGDCMRMYVRSPAPSIQNGAQPLSWGTAPLSHATYSWYARYDSTGLSSVNHGGMEVFIAPQGRVQGVRTPLLAQNIHFFPSSTSLKMPGNRIWGRLISNKFWGRDGVRRVGRKFLYTPLFCRPIKGNVSRIKIAFCALYT
jgi:hypothetical protein